MRHASKTAISLLVFTIAQISPGSAPLALFRDQAINEADAPAPIDYGSGPGRAPRIQMHVPAIVPTGPSSANVTGVFGAAVPWPIVAIHAAMLPDGRVLNFGSDTRGNQGTYLVYDVWTPSLGTGSDAHMVLPNTTGANFFCAAQSLLPGNGLGNSVVFVVGGTAKGPKGSAEAGSYNGINNSTLFSPAANSIAAGPAMVYPRWYASMTPLPNGQIFVAGGRGVPSAPITTPELYDPLAGWIALTGATSSAAFSLSSGWFYPRLFLAPSGEIIDIGFQGHIFQIDPTGAGAISQLPSRGLIGGNDTMPVAMYAPGQLLALRSSSVVETIDITGPTPVITHTAPIDQVRLWSNMTVLADGTVMVNGGSQQYNKLVGVDYTVQLWNPVTGAWTQGATATIPRIYHSSALLLQDGSVLTAGGGDPGPVRNLNAEIYYPPYLYDSTGAPAAQPTITSAPAQVAVGQTLTLQVGAGQSINRVTFLRAGSSTHSANLDQRFFDLAFSQTGTEIDATLPANPNLLLPGYYMVYAFANGVPSIASMVLVTVS